MQGNDPKGINFKIKPRYFACLNITKSSCYYLKKLDEKYLKQAKQNKQGRKFTPSLSPPLEVVSYLDGLGSIPLHA
jgi:hypothetical protein